jgi:DNA (cytosine-5)-methyltransferase 1
MTGRQNASSRPRILDLFCCQGGAAMGYHNAGFEVVGVDIDPQPHYPFEFWQMDALTWGDWDFFDAIHASPPCQRYSKATHLRGYEHPDLIAATRELLIASGLPYVIENVEGARDELVDPVMLCGSMFGLRVYRHRYFETNFSLTAPWHPKHWLRQVKMGRPPAWDEIHQPVGNFSAVDEGREAMEMPWASRDGLREAIPPRYAEHVGGRLMAHLLREAAA